MNVVQKILEAHLLEGELNSGNEIGIKIDQTLTQDATGTMAYLEFEAIGIEKIKTELSASYIDHNTIQDGFENADDHLYLQSIAEKYGLYFSKAGNGICHQVHLETFAVPGKTLLGSDSHTPTAGGMGMIAIGAGGLDVATALAGGAFYLPAPKVLKVTLSGKLNPYVTAKDIILKVLQLLSTKGNVGYIVEYSGNGLKSLSIPERATITNMGAELGVTTSVFPSDNITKEFLKAQGREKDWQELLPDPDATYDKELSIDLNSLKSMIALPHSPDNVKEVSEIAGLAVDQVLIGSCTNSSYKDLYTTSKLLDNQVVSPMVSFGVAPGSKQVFQMLTENNLLQNIISAGGRILESTCGFCIGMGQSPSTNAVSLRTNNRNFLGRSGTKSANVYLVSPETALASALTGKITDPEIYFKNTKINFTQPTKYINNNSLLISPLADSDRKHIKILKGPNIGDPPINDRLSDNLSLKCVIKVEDKITTDHIMPAGPYLKYRSNIGKYSEVVFINVDPDFAKNCRNNVSSGYKNIIVGGQSYGQGSSREHAAICPMHLGVKVVLVKSIERIHRANLINFGIIPLIFKKGDDYDSIGKGDELLIENIIKQLKAGQSVTVINKTKNGTYSTDTTFSDREIDYLIAGGKLNLLQRQA
ncbi:MAG: aconitate hydratase [Candidatus Margulisbacteria bacterium GWF2_35_9]|nr:MAG: aconitate hydratase [Candidatus Margulisbacteria bacterium GWF2_35_9]